MDSAAKHYWAFISYSSKDEKVARRLHRALEHYRVPRDLVGRPTRDGEPVPRRLFPIFRDRDELPLSADLGDAIEGALRASRYLIVLCSPSAAASRWVNEEIRLFKQAGGEGRILAIMLSGEPNASDREETAAMECFPPALRYCVGKDGSLSTERCEPIAGDLRPDGDGWTACLQKAVAGITGLGLAALTKREAVRARRRRVLAAATILVLASCLYGWWDYTRTKVVRYAHLGQRFGVPEGVGSLQPAAAARRNSSYLVATSRGKVRKVSRVNGSGMPVPDIESPESASVQDLNYREDGSLETIEFRNAKGKLLVRYRFAPPEETAQGGKTVVVRFEDTTGKSAGMETWGLRYPWGFVYGFPPPLPPSKAANSVVAHKYEFDRDGWLVRRINLNNYNSPRSDAGAFGMAYENEKNTGLVVGKTLLDKEGRALQSTVRYRRDPGGNIIETSLSGQDSAVGASASLAIAVSKKLHDEHGNQIEESYFLADGQPMLVGDEVRYHKWTAEFDERGNEVERTYLGLEGPAQVSEGNYARITRKFDKRGNQIEEAYFDENERPIIWSDNGCAKKTSKFDERGNEIETAYFDKEGDPVLGFGGCAKIERKFDERGNEVEEILIGLDGEPVTGKLGRAKTTRKFDERGNQIEESYFGSDGQPAPFATPWHKADHVRWTKNFDNDGNELETSYFGAYGQPVLYLGASRVERKFDDRGNLIEEAYFDQRGQPTASQYALLNCAKRTSKFDERGNEIEAAYFDADGQLIFKSTHEFDERGNNIGEILIGPLTGTLLGESGYAKTTRKFDERGNQIEEAFFGTDGKPALNKNGFAKTTRKFDERGNQIEEAFFGTDGEPVLWELGYAKLTLKFDSRGNKIEAATFGTNGEPVLQENGCAKWTASFDDRGNELETRYFGTDGKPILNNEGYAKRMNKFDKRGNLVETAYFGLSGEQLSIKD